MEVNETFYLNIVMEIQILGLDLFYKYKNNYIKYIIIKLIVCIIHDKSIVNFTFWLLTILNSNFLNHTLENIIYILILYYILM